MGFDSKAKAIGTEGVLALQVAADRADIILRERFHRERSVRGATFFSVGAEREITSVWMDQWVVVTEGVASVA